MDEAIDDASTDKRAAWDKPKWERHENQKGRCERRELVPGLAFFVRQVQGNGQSDGFQCQNSMSLSILTNLVWAS
jgi:hypothetical protein